MGSSEFMLKYRKDMRGFTLVELLVVIAILSMLIGLMLPSMSKARTRARDAQCLSHLHSLYLATTEYLHDYDVFPEMNNDVNEGAWQYNYVIYDGRDFESNFGPLVADERTIDDLRILFCPRQTDPYHSFATAENPWPVVPLLDTRAGYGRRYNLGGKSLAQLRGNPGIMADIFHLPKVIKTGHEDGINAVYLDGSARFVPDREKFTDSELTHPFEIVDNDIVEDLWDYINRATP